jgi:hypothetical protein
MRVWIVAVAALVVAWSTAAADERAERWRTDIGVARTEWLAKDRSFAPDARAEAERRLAMLSASAAQLADFEIAAELARVAALSKNAHTRAYLLRNRGYWRRYPIRIWKFADGWRVIAAQGPGEALIGRKIVAVGGVPIAAAQAAVRDLFAGNDRWADYMASYSLTSPEALRAGKVAVSDTVAFSAEDDRGRTSVVLEPMPFVPRDKPEEAWWFLSPAHAATQGWAQALGGRPLPVVLQGAAANYRLLPCGSGVLYFQFNRAQDGDGETLEAFGVRLLAQLGAAAPAKLIVDLRFNTGGDATKAHQFLKVVTAMPWTRERGRVVVIVGPNTFSAGITHAVWLKQETAATFVGTEPGDELDSWSEGGNVDLPNAKLRLHYADMAHRYSKRPADIPADQVMVDWNVDNLTPDLPVDWTWAAYAGGRDPYMERALERAMSCGA